MRNLPLHEDGLNVKRSTDSHAGLWYAEGGEAEKADGSNVPSDWHDPNPIPFLVVEKEQLFQFGIGKRAGSPIELGKVTKALIEALQWIGEGAKTAAGYGTGHAKFEVITDVIPPRIHLGTAKRFYL